MIKYFTGDATEPIEDGVKIVAHICNDIGAWGSGFTRALSRKWYKSEESFRDWANGGRQWPPYELGKTLFVEVDPSLRIYVANMVAQQGIGWKRGLGGVEFPPIRYDWLSVCLDIVGRTAENMNAGVHMPRIGCGLAGGSWGIIEPLIQQNLRNVEVYVYDLP